MSCPTCKFKMRNKGISSLCHNAGILILVILGFVFIDIFFFILGHIFLLCMPGHFLLDVNFTLLGVRVLSVCIFFVLECSHLETLCSFQDLLLNFARAAFSLGLPLSVTEAVSKYPDALFMMTFFQSDGEHMNRSPFKNFSACFFSVILPLPWADQYSLKDLEGKSLAHFWSSLVLCPEDSSCPGLPKCFV